jgi:hypothetical protein
MNTTEYNGTVYNSEHGSPFDRGSSDSYYRRSLDPHYYDKTDGKLVRRVRDEMTYDQIQEYYAGYEYNEMLGDYKDYGQYDYV